MGQGSAGWVFLCFLSIPFAESHTCTDGDRRDMDKEAMQMVRDGVYKQCMIVCDEIETEEVEDENGMHGYVERNGNRRIFHGYCDTVRGRKEYEIIVWEKGREIICYNIER